MTDTEASIPPPATFGLPSSFTGWREDQFEAAVEAAGSESRFQTICAPTGFGKSLTYVAVAKLLGARTCILTSTKGLQDQLCKDFAAIGMTDIRGQNAYTCKVAGDFGLAPTTSVADGPCHAGARCSLKEGGCYYFDALRLAARSEIVVTNYAFWLHSQKMDDGRMSLGHFDLLILDEAHDAPEELSSFMGVELYLSDLRVMAGVNWMQPGTTVEDWAQWSRVLLKSVKEKYDAVSSSIQQGQVPKSSYREAALLKKLGQKLSTLAGMKQDWVVEYVENQYDNNPDKRRWFKFDPVWPNRYAELYLFRGVARVILVSATVRPKTGQLLGIPEGQMQFKEWRSCFPIDQRPVIHVPTVQLNYKSDSSHTRLWLSRIDQILDQRGDRKGIIHAVSYKRAREIMANSRHSHRLLSHSSSDTRYRVEEFKNSTRPVVFVSPSVTTGYDFPYETCEFQIIGKVPFPDGRAAVIKARTQVDKEYINYIAAQNLVQMTGRGMRAEDDRCETLIIDDNIRWFVGQNRRFMPQWFLESYRSANTIPKPLDKLRR